MTRAIKDSELIETAKRQLESIGVVAEQLKREGAHGDGTACLSGKKLEDMGSRLEAYLSGLRNTVSLIEARMVRAR